MPDHEPVPAIADEVPGSERLTKYDDRHVETYARLLEAANEGLPKDEIARRILGIDPDAEPGRPQGGEEPHGAGTVDGQGRVSPRSSPVSSRGRRKRPGQSPAG